MDYDAWAQKYDRTRGASPSVLAPLRDALGAAVGRTLLDIGGGTGNYAAVFADDGFRVTLCDFSPGMAQQARPKLPDCSGVVTADAQHLPFRDASFDCIIAVKVINHVPDWRRFLREARRVVHGGPFVMVHATRESLRANWIAHYIPSLLLQERFLPADETLRALRDAGFAYVSFGHVRYTDVVDGSAQALKHRPELFLEDRHVMNTSLLSRLPAPERDTALAAIRRDYASGRLQEVIAEYEPAVAEYGDGHVFRAEP